MQRARIMFPAGISAALLFSLSLAAHPMGNFSVNHYARILPGDGGAEIRYVLDFAEIPTLELLQKWNLQASSPEAALESRAVAEARGWVENLAVTVGGAKAPVRFEGARMTLTNGAGGMKVMRVEMNGSVKSGPGTLQYEDRNYPDRAGWKEVVVGSGADRSQALTAYPQDALVPRPQQLRGSADLGGPGRADSQKAIPLEHAASTPAASAGAPQAAGSEAGSPAQTANSDSGDNSHRGDYLSSVLHGGEITFGVGLVCMLVAFGLGAAHAFEPGHGKTMVAAYLVGSRGTPKHAVLLGLMTTATHTITVFLLGFVTIFLSRYIMPEKMTKVLGVISGLSIVWIGGLMLYKRSRKLSVGHSHSHDHVHEHGVDHAHHGHHHDHAAMHVHTHDAAHSHAHSHEAVPAHSHGEGEVHTHDHGHSHEHGHSHNHGHTHDHGHHHMPEGEITMASLVALGASGGMVPCPAALILLLTAISLGRPGFGMLLLLSFSIGLAIILMATGMVVLYAKHLIPEKHRDSQSPFMRILPVLSAGIIVVVGIVMTCVSMGWIRAVRFLG